MILVTHIFKGPDGRQAPLVQVTLREAQKVHLDSEVSSKGFPRFEAAGNNRLLSRKEGKVRTPQGRENCELRDKDQKSWKLFLVCVSVLGIKGNGGDDLKNPGIPCVHASVSLLLAWSSLQPFSACFAAAC